MATNVDYAKWNKELRRRKTAITRAWNQEDWAKVIELCVSAKQYFDTIIWPDDWTWYQRMYQDAQQKAGVHWSQLKEFDDL